MDLVQTPLLAAFRARRTIYASSDKTGVGDRSQAFAVLLCVLLVIAVCIYLATLEPIANIRSVEFIHPDVVVLALVAFACCRALIKGNSGLPENLIRPLVLFFVASALSAAVATDKLRAFAAIAQMLEFVTLAWSVSLIGSAKRALSVVHFLLGVFVVQSSIAIGQFMVDDPYPRGTFFTNQKYAMFMGCGAAMSFSLFAVEPQPVRKTLYFGSTLITVIGALLGQERAPWLAFVLSGTVILWYAGKNKKRLAIAFVSTICMAVVLVASVPELRDRTTSRIAETQIQGEKKNTLLSRLAVWGVALNLFREHPLLGVGPKNFVSMVPTYLTSDEMGGLEAAESHNVWLGILAEGGIIGFATYCYLVVSMLRLATRQLGKLAEGNTRSLFFAYIAYNAFWLVMSYHYFTKGEGHIHFLMLGLLIGTLRSLQKTSPELASSPVIASDR